MSDSGPLKTNLLMWCEICRSLYELTKYTSSFYNKCKINGFCYLNANIFSAIQDILSELSPSLKLFKFTHRPLNTSNSRSEGSGDGIEDFINLLETTPPASWTLADGEGFQGKILYIYTSGTTGLPKAAVITSAR